MTPPVLRLDTSKVEVMVGSHTIWQREHKEFIGNSVLNSPIEEITENIYSTSVQPQ